MKFIHLSDLHFNPENDGIASRNLRKELITYLKDLSISVDELLITGDYRHAKYQKENPEDIKDVVEYIWEIAHAISITDVKHIHIVPGNHDLDRKIRSESKMKQIRAYYDPNNGTFEKKDLDYLKKAFNYFDLVCNALYGSKCVWNKANPHTYCVQSDTVFLCLNTAIMQNSDNDRHHLFIGTDCVDRLLNEINEKYYDYPIVVLAHHSPDLFEKHEKETFEDILRKNPKVFLYLCGDAHEMWLRKVNNCLEITMGCIKHDRGVEKTFLYGDTEINAYSVHHWVRAWEPFTYANNRMNDYFPCVSNTITNNEIEKEQNRLKNDSLFPWMKNSPSTAALFPELFIEPIYNSIKMRCEYSGIDDILNKNRGTNVVITGEAGIGKTTILRQQFLFNNAERRFLYLHARALITPTHQLRAYQKFVKNLLLKGMGDDDEHIVLLDGIDEAYTDNIEDFKKIISLIDKLKNTYVWFGWRKEHLDYNETEELHQITRDIISLSKWTPSMALLFIERYAKIVKKTSIVSDYNSLVADKEEIKAFTESPFLLALLAYLLERKDDDVIIAKFFSERDQTIYNLYTTFFKAWMKNERLRETSYLSFDEIREELWSISKNLYYNHSYEISTDDTAITGLLKYSDILEKNVTGEFYHHSLCAFFLADSVYNAIRKGDKLIIEALCIPLKNDVTDFVRSAISGSDQPEIKRIQQNLKEAYIQIDDLEKNILSKKAKDMIREMSEEERFVIKNELIYLMTRIPDPTKTIPAFLEDIHAKNRDPYILLDIAYAATLTGPTQITLDYAKTLSPDSPNGLINRSWTIAYFGDVQANPHIYKDTEKAPWRKSREARLKRFQSSSFKALRFRILDFPLLYCFYVDREWRDVNEKDYKIIEKTDIENAVFSDDERLFLKQKKSQLLQGFKNHLLNNEVHSEWTPTSEPQVFDCG